MGRGGYLGINKSQTQRNIENNSGKYRKLKGRYRRLHLKQQKNYIKKNYIKKKRLKRQFIIFSLCLLAILTALILYLI